MKNNWITCILLVAALAATAAVPAPAWADDEAAWVITDKEDYIPGEIAWITGGGFWPGEPVDLSISIDDPVTGAHVADYAWTITLADGSSEVHAWYEVPDEAHGMVLTLTAMGYLSKHIAATKFTDGGTVPVTASNMTFSFTGNTVNVSVRLVSTKPTVTAKAHFGVVTPGSSSCVPDSFFCNLSLISGTNLDGIWSATAGSPSNPLCCGTTYKFHQVHLDQEVTHQGAGLHTHDITVNLLPDVQTATEACPVNPPPCPTNTAPTITATDKDFGQIVGCLVGGCTGSFQTTVNFSTADFNPVTGDGDGDPVTVTADVSS